MSKSFIHSWRTLLLCITGSLLGYLVPLSQWGRIPNSDWGYYASLALVVRSNVIHFLRFPLHDPWVDGGADLLANPQSRIFSPTLVLDLLLPPYEAQWATLFIFGCLGLWGMYLAMRSRGISSPSSWVLAFIFINSSWFGLHFAEGHVSYGSMQLFPWIYFWSGKTEKKESLFGLSSIFTFFLLEGAIYAFIFGILLLAARFFWDYHKLKVIFSRPGFLAALLIACGLMASAKIVPLLWIHGGREPIFDFTSVNAGSLWKMFFNPLQSGMEKLDEAPWRFHEFGCYVGIFSCSILAFYLRKYGNLVKETKYLFLCVVFLWTAIGWGDPLNPWGLFQRIPLVNSAHVQSRLLILSYFFFLLMLGKALDDLKKLPRFYLWVIGFLLVEAIFVRNYPFYETYRVIGIQKPALSLIRSNKLLGTMPFAEKPQHYLRENLGAKASPEPTNKKTAVLAITDGGYGGEIYFLEGNGKINLLEFSPGKVRVSYSLENPGLAQINTNFLGGWISKDRNVEIKKSTEDLLTFSLPKGEGEVVLEYSPQYLPHIFISFVLGILLWCGLAIYLLKKKEPSPHEYAGSTNLP